MIKKIPYLITSICFFMIGSIAVYDAIVYGTQQVYWLDITLYYLISITFALVFIPIKAFKITASSILSVAVILSLIIANRYYTDLIQSIEIRNYYWTYTLIDITPYNHNVVMDLCLMIHAFFLTFSIVLFIVRIQNYYKLRIIKYFLFGTISVALLALIVAVIYTNQLLIILIY